MFCNFPSILKGKEKNHKSTATCSETNQPEVCRRAAADFRLSYDNVDELQIYPIKRTNRPNIKRQRNVERHSDGNKRFAL